MEGLVTTKKATEILGIHEDTLREYVRLGWIRRYMRNRRHYVYRREDLEKFMKRMMEGEFT